jgi:uncharacterized protein (TIGR02147 family)
MFVDYLKNDLSERCRKNPKYSLRAYARCLDIDSSTLSGIMSRKRPLSLKVARRIIVNLEGDSPTFLEGLLLKEGAPEARPYRALAEDEFELISDWQHFAVHSALQLSAGEASAKSIAKRFGVAHPIIAEILERLERLKLAKRNGNYWVATQTGITTTSDIPNAALRKANRQCIERALLAQENCKVEDRDITGITMAISKRKLPEAKARIKKFRREMAELLESGHRDEVYRLNVQLFPLS